MSVATEKLRSIVERLEYIAAEKHSLSLDAAEVMAEAKADGFITKAIRAVIRKRAQPPSERSEEEQLEDVYLHAMGMLPETRFASAVGMIAVDITMREEVVEALRPFVPASGSIEIVAGGARVRLTRDEDGFVSIADVVDKPGAELSEGVVKPRRVRKGAEAVDGEDLPEVDAGGAVQLGRLAFRADKRIIDNPFPRHHEHRPRWDKGWREESGITGVMAASRGGSAADEAEASP